MTGADPVDRLIDRGVFEAAADGVRLTDEFRTAVTEHRNALTEAAPGDVEETMAELVDDRKAATALRTEAEEAPDLIARYLAVAERDETLTPAQALTLSVLVGHLEDGRPRAEGAPDAFLPVDGDDLVRLVNLYGRCVVYIWREDCPPCQTVRAEFDAIFGADSAKDVMLLSVYGPGCSRLLQEEYDVVGAPTTLFTLGGAVDARLVGAPAREAIEREIETLRERTFPGA